MPCDPVRKHLGKGKREVFFRAKKHHVRGFVLVVWPLHSSGSGCGFRFPCLRLRHCEDVIRVFRMLCSAKAGWFHQALEQSGLGGAGFTGGAGGLHSCKSVKSGIEPESLLVMWMAVVRGATAKKPQQQFLVPLLYVRLLPSQGPAPPKLMK